MMSWSLTPDREAVNLLTDLWRRPEWRSSNHATAIRMILNDVLDGSDEVNRLRATDVARLLATDHEAALQLVQSRLLTEQHPHIAAALIHQLHTFSDSHPIVVDDTITPLVRTPLWVRLLAMTERDSSLREVIGTFVRLVLYLALRHQTPTAAAFVELWFTNPIDSEAARQAVGRMRSWMALPPDRANERKRAFELIRIAIASLIHTRETVDHDHDSLRAALKVADTIAHDLYFASGAHVAKGDSPKLPGTEFAQEAFETLQMMSVFKSPSTVHQIVLTLNHLSPLSPRQAFLIASEAIATGDAYTYDTLAADETASLIERYFSEFRDCVLADSELLAAIRSVLHAFVDAGWPSATTLAYDLSEAFR
jgi:hypothetical protein